MEKHKFEPSDDGKCGVYEDDIRCGKRAKHLIHKAPKIPAYNPGEVVGQYFVGSKGEFRKIKDEKESNPKEMSSMR